MKIWILFDYDDRPIRASCDGISLQQEAEKLGDCGDGYTPYWVIDIELEDVPIPVLKFWKDYNPIT